MKYRNRKVENEAGVFDSQKEYLRFMQLKELEAAGGITNLRRQVKYNLVPTQKLCNGVTFRAINYIADFVYEKDGQDIVEDVKPTFRSAKSEKAYKSTAAYKTFTLKKKLMYYFLHIIVTEI